MGNKSSRHGAVSTHNWKKSSARFGRKSEKKGQLFTPIGEEMPVEMKEEIRTPIREISEEVLIPSTEVKEEPTIRSTEVKEEPTIRSTEVKEEPTIPSTEVKEEPMIPSTEVKEEPTIPSTEVKEEPMIPSTEVKEKLTIPSTEVKEEPTIPNTEVKDESTIPSTEVKEEPTIPSTEVKEEPTVSGTEVKEEPTIPSTEVKEKLTIPSTEVKEEPMIPNTEVKEESTIPCTEVKEEKTSIREFTSYDDETRKFHQQLCQYEDHALRMTYEYFQYDLLHIVETMNMNALLDELYRQDITDVEKYQSLEKDRKTWARILLQDIHCKGREAVMGLWVSLLVSRRRHGSLSLDAVLDELCHRGESLVGEILLDEHGHQLLPEMKDIHSCHKNYLYKKTENLMEKKPSGSNQGEESFPFSTRYVNLIIVSTHQFRERSENELIKTGVKHEEYLKKVQNELHLIFPNKLFRWCHRSRHVPHMVMVSGVPGVGKTTLMQKFVYDWVRGDHYQRFSFVFFFQFRELNRLDNVSLETLILHQYPHLEQQLEDILQDPEKLLFIFDGLDESLHTMDFTSRHLCSNPKQPEPCGHIVVSLVRKSLLNGCSVLMTSRPTRLASIDCNIFQRIVEITGFFQEERQMYFKNFFPNPEQAEKAFNYVKQNETLYTFCYLPSYCWIICTVLSRSFTSSDQPMSLLPKTVTQLFAIFVANILANHSLHKNDAKKILRSIGWMAEHGVMNHKIIFDDRDLASFHVDNESKLLSSFLLESEEPVSYSFLHLTVQEFFSAFFHYADYSPGHLRKSLKEAKSYSDERGEMFLRFLCGLSDSSTRSILSEYLDKQAAQASRDVITLMKDFIPEKQGMKESEEKKRLLNIFFYLFETRNKALVRESFRSHRRFDLSFVHMSALDVTVLAFILKTCSNIEELNLSGCSLNIAGFETLRPALHNLQILRLNGNNLPDISCIQLASAVRNNRSLEKLFLSYNSLNGLHFNDLMEALSSPDCKIEELHLAHNGLPNTSCICLASGIRNNQSLKKLVLHNNHLSGPHLRDLMEALSSPDCSIETLHMEANEWTEDEKEGIRKLQQHNPNLMIFS